MKPIAHTRETTRLHPHAPVESHVGLLLETERHSIKVVYKRTAAPHRGNTPARAFGLGLTIGGFILLAVGGYGMPLLGGLVLASLIVLAVWNVGRE